jgi:outer membrane lipoprotein-sorting protein
LAHAVTPPVEEIVRRADEARGPAGDLSFHVEVQDYNGSSLLRTNRYHVYSKGEKYVLVETEYPERLQGRKLLMRDDDVWMYLPSIKQPTRISLQQKLTGEVSNGDLAKTSFHEDYEPKLLGIEKRKGGSYFKLLLSARSKSCTYRRIKLWVNTRNFRPLRAEYFAISGKLMKTGDFFDPKPALGQPRMSRVVIQDALEPQRRSLLHYYDYRRESLDASFFSKESLP